MNPGIHAVPAPCAPGPESSGAMRLMRGGGDRPPPVDTRASPSGCPALSGRGSRIHTGGGHRRLTP